MPRKIARVRSKSKALLFPVKNATFPAHNQFETILPAYLCVRIMGWRFRKSFQILPGIRLNFGKGGFTSVSVGKRGFTTNIGKDGVSQNVGIPGTGLSFRANLWKAVSSDRGNLDEAGSSGSGNLNETDFGETRRKILWIVGASVLCVIAITVVGIGAFFLYAQVPKPSSTPVRIVSNVESTPIASTPTSLVKTPTPTKVIKTKKIPQATATPYEYKAILPFVTTPQSSSPHIYFTGPRGGCYYINSRGNRTYVDRSKCG